MEQVRLFNLLGTRYRQVTKSREACGKTRNVESKPSFPQTPLLPLASQAVIMATGRGHFSLHPSPRHMDTCQAADGLCGRLPSLCRSVFKLNKLAFLLLMLMPSQKNKNKTLGEKSLKSEI